MTTPAHRYTSGHYLRDNPSWDREDGEWKAAQVLRMLRKHKLAPPDLVEIGCGAGDVLAQLSVQLPNVECYGFDIAPDAKQFWEKHKGKNISFVVGDFTEINKRRFTVALILDVIEHVSDTFEFLQQLREQADYYIFHIPLDLSALSVLREKPLLHVRAKVGHIHYFTRGLALALLQECGYEVLDWDYTGASLTGPRRGWKTRLAGVVRHLAYAMNKDVGVRLLGGETIIILARPGAAP
jgi:SAM-dependent methyltransferase